jgi:hypothetical protein
MAHTTRRLDDTAWLQIAADSEDFDVYNTGPGGVFYALASSTPLDPDTGDDNQTPSYHILPSGERIARGNLTDALYMRAVEGIQRVAILT